MRKVFHSRSSIIGMIMSVVCSLALTVALFSALPFAHRMAMPSRTLELRKVTAVEQKEEVKEELLQPPEETEKPPETEVQPQLTETVQEIPLSADLELAVGSGGVLKGFGERAAITAATAVQEETFDVSDLQKRPEPVSQTPPSYPLELKKQRIEGVVTLIFVLNEEGRVEDPRVENSSRPEFEKPALEAIRKWRFRPGEKDGVKVRTFIRQGMRFRVPTG